MKAKRKRKGLTLVLAIAVAIAMIPSQIFAATQTEYKTEGGVNTGYQKITIDDTVFNDVSGAIGGELTEDNEHKMAAGVIEKWSDVVVDVFDSETAVWGVRNAPTYINSLALNFAESLKHKGKETDRKIDLSAWFSDTEERKIDTDSQMKSTGLKKTTSLSDLRDIMGDHISESIGDVYGKGKSAVTGDTILGAKYDKLTNHRALDRLAEETDKRNVYYNLVTSINKSKTLGVPCAYYNSYLIAVYDVSLSPIIAEEGSNLSYVKQEEESSDSETGEEEYIAKVNDTGDVLTTNIKQDNLKKQTMANTMLARENGTFPFEDPTGDSHWNELPFLNTIGDHLLRSTDPVKAVNSTMGDKYTNEENNLIYKNVTMPEDTCVRVHKTSVKETRAASYSAPYAVDYKVAVFSLSGEIHHPTDKSMLRLSYYGDYYSFFGRNTKGAVENLALRTSDAARNDSSYETNYADTAGCVKESANVSKKIHWFDKTMGLVSDGGHPDHGGGHYTASIMGRQKDNIESITEKDRFMTSGDGIMRLETERVIGEAYDDLVPMHPLVSVTTSWQHDTGRELLNISLNNNRAWNLGAISLGGYNEAGEEYYGFDGSAFGGDWVICDKDGNEVDPESSPLRIKDTRDFSEKTGTQVLLTESEGTGYIRWKIKEGITYENGIEPMVKVSRENTPSKPVRITVIPPADPDDAVIELIPDGDLTVSAGEDLDLNEHIETRITGGGEPDETIPGKFFIEENTPDAKVSPEGIFKAEKPGAYEIRGAMMIDETKFALTSENTVTITVTGEKAPETISAIEPPQGELSPVCKEVGYELLPLVSITDNYGKVWEDKDKVSFTFKGNGKTIEGKAAITGEDDPLLLITEPGTYEVVAKYEEGEKSIETVITFNVRQIKGINDPAAAKALTYNGKPQIGVTAEEGCILRNEKQTEAGLYRAKARPEDGYCWMDGTTDEKTIPYYIHEARISIPKAKSLTYNGKTQTGVPSGFGYAIEGGKAKNAGTYTAKARLLRSCLWDDGSKDAVVIKYTVAKAKNPLSVKGKTAKVARDKLKVKSLKLSPSRVMTFKKKGKGKITYTKSSGNRKITINKKTGKVTVKKGLKKGTYKVKAKVKAAGNANYKASKWKTVTFKIKVR